MSSNYKILSTSIEPESLKSVSHCDEALTGLHEGNCKLPVNVREGNLDDELYVVEQSDLDFGQDVNRTPKRPNQDQFKENTGRRMRR